MKRSSTIFLQTVVVLMSIGTLALMLWEPHLEGRNAHATLFEIYFKDPFLAYAYIASIPFFVALFHAFKLLGYVGRNEIFLPRSLRALRIIRYCAIVMVGFIIGGVTWIMLSETDDRPPIIAMGVFSIFVCIVIATATTVFERLLQNVVDKKSENDLTV